LQKSIPVQPHKGTANSTRQTIDRKEGQPLTAPQEIGGSVVTCLPAGRNETLCFVSSSVLADSLVLTDASVSTGRNRQLLVVAKTLTLSHSLLQ